MSFITSDRPVGPQLRRPIPPRYGHDFDPWQGFGPAKPFRFAKNSLVSKGQLPTDEAKLRENPSEMNHEEVLRVKLAVLEREHRDLDEAIHALEDTARADQLVLRRLKRQKLSLKDRIRAIIEELTPDIIA